MLRQRNARRDRDGLRHLLRRWRLSGRAGRLEGGLNDLAFLGGADRRCRFQRGAQTVGNAAIRPQGRDQRQPQKTAVRRLRC